MREIPEARHRPAGWKFLYAAELNKETLNPDDQGRKAILSHKDTSEKGQ